jgi:hypothetical protein
MNWK